MSELIKKGKNVIETAPRVSVVIPAYNVAEYISDTLDSVSAQTYKDFEAIVINDGSPDTEIFEKILDKHLDKIIYIKQKNGGAAVARNTGIENARGEIIAFLDGDDIWFPEFLQQQTKVLDEKNFGMIYCDALFFGDSTGKSETYMERSPSDGDVTPETLLDGRCNVITSGTIVKKEHLVNAGLFNPNAIRTEDFEMWFSMAKRGVKIGYQKKVLLKYRVRKTGLTGDAVTSTDRTIRALNRITERNDLTENEERLRQQQIRLAEAEHELAKGKYFLAREEYDEAIKHIAKANEIDPKPKLKIINLLLRIAPKLTLRLFRKFRAAELSVT
jgi:glycosyltransferase involved in cell wall biosynthesis